MQISMKAESNSTLFTRNGFRKSSAMERILRYQDFMEVIETKRNIMRISKLVRLVHFTVAFRASKKNHYQRENLLSSGWNETS